MVLVTELCVASDGAGVAMTTLFDSDEGRLRAYVERNGFSDERVTAATAELLGRVAEAAGVELDMGKWTHGCGAPACAAGWMVHLSESWVTTRNPRTHQLGAYRVGDPHWSGGGDYWVATQAILQEANDGPTPGFDVRLMDVFISSSGLDTGWALEFMVALSEFCTAGDALDRADKTLEAE